MSSNIIIITSLGEPHGACFREGLKFIGKEPHIWYPDVLGIGSTASVHLHDDVNEILLTGINVQFSIERNDTVLFKRFDGPNYWQLLENTDARNCATAAYNFTEGLFEAISLKCSRPVNPYFNSVKAKRKVFQHLVAQKCGLLTLDTITSNDSYYLKNASLSSKPTVMKGLNTANWKSEKENHTKALTSTRIDLLNTDLSGIQFFPAIYQTFIKAKFEIRSIVFDRKIISAKIKRNHDPKSHGKGKYFWDPDNDFDWRVWSKKAVNIEPYSLPSKIEHKVFKLMDSLGLTFGAVDFIVDHKENIHFLEVNSSGNFLFLEEACDDLNLLDVMCQFLCHSKSDGVFTGSGQSFGIKLSDVKPSADKFMAFERQKYSKYKDNLTNTN